MDLSEGFIMLDSALFSHKDPIKGFLHPSINCEDVHPEIEDFSDWIPRKSLEMPDLRIIAKAGFGFGDVNSCLIFKKWEA